LLVYKKTPCRKTAKIAAESHSQHIVGAQDRYCDAIVAAFALVIYLGLRKRGNRLDAFAKCLAVKQAKMYGLTGVRTVPIRKKCSNLPSSMFLCRVCVPGSRDEAQVCKDAG